MKNTLSIIFKVILVLILIQDIRSDTKDFIKNYKHLPLTEIITFEGRRKGDETLLGDSDYHFVVLILIRQRDAMFRCTATVISKKWVLTSAHCLDVKSLQPKNILVVGGKVDLAGYLQKRLHIDFRSNIGEMEFGVQEHRVQYYRVHPIFDDRRFYHDIALLKTKTSFSFPIEPINLATAKMYNRKNCSIMGYGFDNPFKGVLRKKNNLEVSTTEIGCVLKKKGLFLCFQYPYVPSECLGEAGSPLLCEDSVWGISSFSLKHTQKTDECGPKIEMYYNALYFDRNWIGSVISFSNIIRATEWWWLWWLFHSLLVGVFPIKLSY